MSSRRRGPGEGTVIKRKKCSSCGKVVSAAGEAELKVCKHCGTELSANGTWMGRIACGYNIEKNKPELKYFYGRTRKEVVTKMNNVANRVKTGQTAEPSKMLLAEWMRIWIDVTKKNTVRLTTWESYNTQIKKHITPEIGHIRLSQLTTADIQNLYNKKKQSGLSARSVKYIHTVLSGALLQAEQEGLIIRNPANHAKVPKQERKEIQYYDYKDVAKFLQAARKSKYYMAYYIELATGLRRGELLALRWKDIDMERHILSVTQGLVRVKEGLIFQEPKTKLSRRTLVLPSNVVSALNEHKLKQNIQRVEAGDAWHRKLTFLREKTESNDLVFTSGIGKPLDPSSFVRNFKRMLKREGLPPITFHGLRHTYATMSLQEGVDIKTTQENLGHHTAAFTLDVYSSVTDKMKKEASNKIGNLLTTLDELRS